MKPAAFRQKIGKRTVSDMSKMYKSREISCATSTKNGPKRKKRKIMLAISEELRYSEATKTIKTTPT